jgi:hypothetical protein
MVKDLIAFQKIEDLTIILNPILSRFPKKEQYALSEDIKNELYSIAKLIIHINNSKYEKIKYYNKLNDEFDFLFYLIRLAHKLKYISTHNYMNITERILEVIKICCG